MTIFRYRSARRGKSVDVYAPAAMVTVFPGASPTASAVVDSSAAAPLTLMSPMNP